MNKPQRKVCYQKKVIPINIVTVIFALIIVRCIFRGSGRIFEVAIWGVSFMMALSVCAYYPHISTMEKKLLIAFGTLSFLQVLGLIVLGTSFAIKNTIATFLIGSLVIVVSVCGYPPKKTVIRALYYIYVMFILFGVRNSRPLDNTFSGCFVFVNLFYLAVELNDCCRKQNKFFFCTMFMISTLITVFVIFNSGSRTSLAIFLITLLFFLVIKTVKINSKIADRSFFLIIAVLFIMIVVYANISEISWFHGIDELSRKYFNKNLDSSRGKIWKTVFDKATFFKIIFGRGTGTLPQLERYTNSSFHSTYIQLIAQNGIVGLYVLLYIFRVLWRKLAKHVEDTVVLFVICSFVGVLLYNCFECTLLQNKAFLGAIQWTLIGFGMVRVRILECGEDK